MESILYRELTFDTKTLAQLADGAATVKVYDTEQDFICS
jgi:polyribonucleotide nucleotidyltransferase